MFEKLLHLLNIFIRLISIYESCFTSVLMMAYRIYLHVCRDFIRQILYLVINVSKRLLPYTTSMDVLLFTFTRESH